MEKYSIQGILHGKYSPTSSNKSKLMLCPESKLHSNLSLTFASHETHIDEQMKMYWNRNSVTSEFREFERSLKHEMELI